MFKCNLCWSRDDTLLIGWADSVKIGVVKSRVSAPHTGGGSGSGSGSSRPSPSQVAGPASLVSANRYVQIVAMFTTDYMICGIAPWGPHHLVIMAFLEDEENQNNSTNSASASSSSSSTALSAGGVSGGRRVARATSTDDGSLIPSTSSSAASTPSTPHKGVSPSAVPSLRRPLNSQRPELRIVSLTNEEVSADALPIMGYANYSAQDYKLDYNPNGSGIAAPPTAAAVAALGAAAGVHSAASLVGAVGVPSSASIGAPAALSLSSSSSSSSTSSAATAALAASASASANLDYLFYILAPQDIVVARPRDYDDHLTWLLARSKYEEALHYANTFSAHLKIHNSYEIGENFLKYLFEVEKNYSKAAEYCKKLLGASKSLWETYVLLFAKHDKLKYIAPLIPTANPTLSDHIYELVLNSYLEDESSHSSLLHLLKSWSHHLYHIKHVIESIKNKLQSMENKEREMERSQIMAGTRAKYLEEEEKKEREEEMREKERMVEQEKEKEEKEKMEEEKKGDSSASAAAAKAAKNAAFLSSYSASPASGTLHPSLYPPPPPLPPRSTRLLLEALGELYLLNKQYNLAFDIYLRLQRRSELFRILTTFAHHLLESKLLEERNIALLMRISLNQTLELLVNFVPERIQVKEVMEQLKLAQYNQQKELEKGGGGGAASAAAPTGGATYKVFQYEFLHALFRKDHFLGSKFHDEQVLLYAEFAPKELLYFLKNSNGYLLERALESCEKYKLYSEMVFLLKRMGNTNMALKLIIDELHDVKEAIAFVEENGGRSMNKSGGGGSGGGGGGAGNGGGDGNEEDGEDNSLWEELITRSLNNPLFLSDLLEHVGSHYVDLSKLIVRIPPSLEIPHLKQKLITILNDCELQQSVIKGCTNILRNDCKSLVGRLYRRRKRAIKIPSSTKCAVCEVEILTNYGGGGGGAASSSSSSSSNSSTGVTSPVNSGSSSSSSSSVNSGVMVFFCRHVFHRQCYDSQRSAGERRAEQHCPKCNTHITPVAPNNYQQQQQQQATSNNTSKIGVQARGSMSQQQGITTPAKRTSMLTPASSPPAASMSGFPARSPSGSMIPSNPTPLVRSILPQPSPSASGSAMGATRPKTIPLPQSANVLPNVLPRGSPAASATPVSAVQSARSASPSIMSAPSSSPSSSGVNNFASPSSQSQQMGSNQIKPQATFMNRAASNRGSLSKQ